MKCGALGGFVDYARPGHNAIDCLPQDVFAPRRSATPSVLKTSLLHSGDTEQVIVARAHLLRCGKGTKRQKTTLRTGSLL